MDSNTENNYKGIDVQRLVQATTTWTGAPLPDYPTGRPVVTVLKFTFPPHSVTANHFHEIINCGYIQSGCLTIVNEDGSSRDFHAGEAIVETVGTVHHGENRGDDEVVLIMFYAGDSTTALSTPVQ